MHTARSADGTPLAYDRIGTGPPLVLVQGALSDLAGMLPLAALLAERFTVFAYDRRGRGASGDTPPYAVEREVEDLAAVLAAAGGAAAVFGNCSGAALALEAAARGLPIERMALYEPPYLGPGTRRFPPDYAARLGDHLAGGRTAEALLLFLREAVQLPAGHVARLRDGPLWCGLRRMAHTLAYDAAVVLDGSLTPDRLAAVAVPTLVIDGGDSPAWVRTSARLLVEALPAGRHRTLPGQHHFPPPRAVAPVLLDVLGAG